jgi:hypothetical protein
MNPFTAAKEPLTISLHFTFFSLIQSTLHFTSLCYSYLQPTFLKFTSLHFLSPSLPLTVFHLSNPRFWKYAFYRGKSLSPLRVTWQDMYYKLPDDGTIVSKHVGVIICEIFVHLLVTVQKNINSVCVLTVLTVLIVLIVLIVFPSQWRCPKQRTSIPPHKRKFVKQVTWRKLSPVG